MAELMGGEIELALHLFLTWLSGASGLSLRLVSRSGNQASAHGDGLTIAVEVHPVIESDDPSWLSARQRLERELSASLPGGYALWVPPGAGLPPEGLPVGEFANTVREAALRLGPRERSYLPLPTKLYLRKISESGNVVSVVGGLSQYWARFTERVRGTYELDSTGLHRLPESEPHLEALLDSISQKAADLDVGAWCEVETIDAWTIQRVEGLSSFVIVGHGAQELAEAGLAVRRNTRRILSQAAPALRGRTADLRAIVLLAPYARMENEGVTTAVRGYDPALYSGIDLLCLVADGQVKAVVQGATPPRNRPQT